MSTDDRILHAFRDLVRAEIATFTYSILWEYVVTNARLETSGVVTFDGTPTATDTFPLPNAVRWPLRAGVAGSQFVPAPGSKVYLTFANADPTKPIAIAFDSTAPDSTQLDSTGTMKVGASAAEVDIGSGTDTVPNLAEANRMVCYGDLVEIAVVGAVATGTLKQASATAPNQISKVRGR